MNRNNGDVKLIIKKKAGDPPSKVKIADALRILLERKDFNSITTAEISETAGANEALIYRYFKNKRGLLHQVMEDYLTATLDWLMKEQRDIVGARERLRNFIRITIGIYDCNRVFAKIILLEVRNFPGFFESLSYDAVKFYAGLLTEIVESGISEGVFRSDINPRCLRDLILGAMEHRIMPDVIFKRKMDPDQYADDICKIIFEGIDR